MFSSPTTFVAKLLAAMQVLMTLDMPLSTTIALPVTSKPIESTVENLAWQAWIELPPEQKQQIKSRKVTPKSIFTLPLRVECPEGHKQVDRKCIPIAIGSNAVLIDLNALGLLVGSTQTEDMYDYDDFGEELSSPLAFGSEVPAGEAVKSSDGVAVDLRPPAKDEPLKFNIFQNKFHIFHEEPIEDYSALSNEGVQSSEKEQIATATTPSSTSNNTAASATFLTDLASEASNIAEDVNRFFEQLGKTASASDNDSKQSQTALNLDDDIDFQIEAISIPAFGNHSTVQLVTTIMDAETTTTNKERDKQQDNDLTTLLQTESFLPLLNHTTATTLQDSETYPLTKLPPPESSDTASDLLSLGVDEEITTLTTPMERYLVEAKHKQEYTRSVTLNPLFSPDIDGSAVEASGEDDQSSKTSTLETVTNDDTAETTAPIQLDDTTIIESHSSLSAAAATQQELKELLLQQEQAMKEFEELQRLRKGQKDQHVVLKKSKVQPVEVLSTTTEATMATRTTTTTATAAATAASLPTATKSLEELSTTTAETETATPTPLLTFHNENENNGWFYYQHFAKQDNDVKLRSAAQFEPTTATENVADASPLAALSVTGQPTAAPAQNTATTTTETMQSTETAAETIPLASEIDLAEELLAINELVKGIRQPTTLTTITKMPTVTATTITTTTIATTPASKISSDNVESSLSTSSPSESTSLSSPLSSSSSPAAVKKSPLTTSQIWSKILPLLTTSTTTPMPKNSANESFSETTPKESNVSQAFDSQIHSASFSSERSNRNSKIIRIKGFKKISAAAKLKIKDFTTEAVIIPTTTTTTTSRTEEFTPYLLSTTTTATSETSIPATSSSSAENFTYEPYWWLPASWRLDKPTSTEKQSSQQDATAQSEKQHPLLLRFWSAYRSKSS